MTLHDKQHGRHKDDEKSYIRFRISKVEITKVLKNKSMIGRKWAVTVIFCNLVFQHAYPNKRI